MFDVEVPEEILYMIRDCATAEDLSSLQGVLDRIFTNERREKMLAETSKTRLGTSAVYYRFMPKEQLIGFLDRHVHTPQDYAESDHARETMLNTYLCDYLNELLALTDLSYEKEKILKEEFKELGTVEKMLFVFPDVPRTRIESLVDRMSLSEIQAFFDRHVYTEHKRMAHMVGGTGLVFSNALSASAGGPVSANFGARSAAVYIEFIAPDDSVGTHAPDIIKEDMVMTEKEVFLKGSIPLEWVTRIYVDKKMMMEETVRSSNSAVSRFEEMFPQEGELIAPYRRWLKNAHIKYMLPTSIAKKYDERM